jgi:thiazole synthase
VKITLNGEPHTLSSPVTIVELLAQLEIDPRRVAVERNFVVIKRDAYATTTVEDGDQIEVVNFVGGGSGDDLEIWKFGNLEIKVI